MKKFVREKTPRRKRGKATNRDTSRSREGSSRNFGGPSRGRASGGSRAGPRGRPKSRHELPPVKVTCSSCGSRCEVPFKPTSDKPVYCDQCFASKGKKSPSRNSNDDLKEIHKKLDKIMQALDID